MTADELEKLAKAATNADWVWSDGQWLSSNGDHILWYTSADDGLHGTPADKALIAAMLAGEPARNRIIAALRLVERIEGEAR
jgi:hypothetical protein